MLNFLHNNLPNPILITLGPLTVYWYGLFIVAGILAGIGVALKLAEKHQIPKDVLVDISFWLVLGGIAGARIYHVFLEFSYYLKNPLDIFKLWQGGLAIHGGLLFGIIIIWFLARYYRLNYWKILAIMAPGLALAQAIGRWGNYFNQELFGRPTDLPWGIPIANIHRIPEYYNAQFFHPTFLYESLGNLLIFIALIAFHIWIIKKNQQVTARDNSSALQSSKSAFHDPRSPIPDPRFTNTDTRHLLLVMGYLVMYSLLRLGLEFIRIDTTPALFGLRWPQWVSLCIIFINLIYAYIIRHKIKASLAS